MSSWTNATGLLRPGQTAPRARLRREYPVAPVLVPFVERYWSVSWDRTGRAPWRSEVLSHPCVNLSVESGQGPRHGHALPAALVHGVVTRRFVIDLCGRGRVTAAKFRPGGYAALVGTAVAPDTVTALAEPGLVADLLAVDADDARAAVLDAFLTGHAREPDPDYRFLCHVVALMERDRALTRVDQVAGAAGTSVRALQRLFRRYVGVGPKWLLARHRLQDAAAAIDAGESDLAGLASDLGWFDQAHFSRDFRATVGVTPSSYLASVRTAARA